MATMRHWVVQIIKKSVYLCQFNSDLYETLNLSSSVTNYVKIPTCIYVNLGCLSNGYNEILGTLNYPKKSIYLSQFNSDLYETLNLTSSVTNYVEIPTCIYVNLGRLSNGYNEILGTLNYPKKSIYLSQFNSDLYETLNLSSCGTN